MDMNEVSGTRLYLGNLPRDVTKREVEDFFKAGGPGNVIEVKLMNGFGFIQYDNEEDAKEVVPTFNGREFKGSRLAVQFARGTRHAPREHPNFTPDTRYPRTRRTQFRMNISGLQPDTSWQDLKDFARRSNVDVVFSEVSRDGRGMVEFETVEDMREAVAKLDNTEFKGMRVTCVSEISDPPPAQPRGGNRYRSRSPAPHYRGGGRNNYSPGPRERGGGGGGGGYSPPPRRRDYSPRRDNYRDRSPRREPYAERAPRGEPRDRYSPPPRHGGGGGRGAPAPVDDGYRRPYPDDSYSAPSKSRFDDEVPAYTNGGGRRGPPPGADDMGGMRGGRGSPPPRGGGGGRSPPSRFRASNGNGPSSGYNKHGGGGGGRRRDFQ